MTETSDLGSSRVSSLEDLVSLDADIPVTNVQDNRLDGLVKEIFGTEPETEPKKEGQLSLSTQFDTMRKKVNGFLEKQRGKKVVVEKRLVKQPYKNPLAPSLQNGYGILWLFGIGRYEHGTRFVEKEFQREVVRDGDEGLDELQKIVDSYIVMYQKYAEQIKKLCKDQILHALRETTTIKMKYYAEVLEARKNAIDDAARKEKLILEYARKEEVFKSTDPQSEAAIALESELDTINLHVARYTNRCIMHTKEVGYKRDHANLLKFVEYGLYLIYQTAANSARIVVEFVRQLEHMRTFSVPTTKTIRDLVAMDEKINEGKPYLTQSSELLMGLLGCAFGNYNGFTQGGTGDVTKILDGIKQFHERSQKHYAATTKALEQMKKPEVYVSPSMGMQKNEERKEEPESA